MNTLGTRCAWLITLSASLAGCLGTVEGRGDYDSSQEPNSVGESGAQGPAGSSVEGIPCKYLRGQASLTSYDGDNYASSAFSFEFASQDPEVTHNEFDVVYEVNLFLVNTVTDDQSFLVDLGDTPFEQVPATVDPDDYPLGNWGEHDALQAQVHHTYFVRSVDNAGRGVSAFRVIGLEPGVRVTIAWVRSTDADLMKLPEGCGL